MTNTISSAPSNRGLLQTHHVVDKDLQLVGVGAKLDGVAPGVDSPPPTLGEHTSEILTELGYDNDQISIFKNGRRYMTGFLECKEVEQRWHSDVIRMNSF